MSGEIEQAVIEAIAAVGKPEKVDLDASWRAQGIDSLDLLDVVLRTERALGCSVPDEAAVRLFTPRDLLAALANASAQQTSVPVIRAERVAVPVRLSDPSRTAEREQVSTQRSAR
jgi:acyl carrier protein